MQRIAAALGVLLLAAPAVRAQWNQTPPSAAQVVTCGSNNFELERCTVPGWRGAALVQQTSQAACVWARTWGFVGGSIWVDKGCRGTFTAAYDQRPLPPGGYPPGAVLQGNPDPGQTIGCGSDNFRQDRCAVPQAWRGARLVKQESHAPCVWGQTWGFNYGSVWVGNGCRGKFAAAEAPGGWQPGLGWDQNIRLSCGSPQYKYAFCQVDVGAHGSVVLEKQTSHTRCELGRNWGWNRAGVWVDKGCGGRFLVLRRW